MGWKIQGTDRIRNAEELGLVKSSIVFYKYLLSKKRLNSLRISTVISTLLSHTNDKNYSRKVEIEQAIFVYAKEQNTFYFDKDRLFYMIADNLGNKMDKEFFQSRASERALNQWIKERNKS